MPDCRETARLPEDCPIASGLPDSREKEMAFSISDNCDIIKDQSKSSGVLQREKRVLSDITGVITYEKKNLERTL